MGAVRGAEARHGDADDVLTRQTERVEGQHGHEQREGGIEAAGHADDRLLAADVLQARGQARHLGGEDLAAAHAERLRIALGDEGMRLHVAEELRLEIRRGGFAGVLRDVSGQGPLEAEAVLLGAQGVQALDVHVGEDGAAVAGEALGFGKQGAVLADERGAGPDEVLRGFAFGAGSVNVCGIEPGSGGAHEALAVFVLEEIIVAGGEVQDQLRAGHGGLRAGGNGNPQVLAELDGGERLSDAEELARAEQDLVLAGEADARTGGGEHPRGGEPARLVEFVVAGEVGLGDDAENAPGAQGDGAVEEPSGVAHGDADDEHRLQLGAGGDDLRHGGFRVGEQALLAEQVGAGVAGHAEFREDDDGGTLRFQVPAKLEDFPGVRRRVGHVHARHGRRYTNESKTLHTRKYSGFA